MMSEIAVSSFCLTSNFLWVNGFKFRKGYVSSKGPISWRCTNKTCSVTVKTDSSCENLIGAENGEHTHDPPKETGLPSPKKAHILERVTRKSVSVNTPSRRDNSLPTHEDTLREIELQQQRDDLIAHVMQLEAEMETERKENESLSLIISNKEKEIDDLITGKKLLEEENGKLRSRINNSSYPVGVQTDMQFSHRDNIKILPEYNYSDILRTIANRERELVISEDYNNNLLHRIDELEVEIDLYRSDFRDLHDRFENLKKRLTSFPLVEQQSPLTHRLNKKRLIIFSDSHGRQVTDLLRNALPDFSVSGSVYPGATFEVICHAVSSALTRDIFDNDDYLVIVGGTNSFQSKSTELDSRKYIDSIKNIIKKAKHTNLIIGTIPYRYDLSSSSVENKLIHSTNAEIRKLCTGCKIEVIEIWNFERRFFTRHGLHMNRGGKRKLTNMISKFIYERSLISLSDITESSNETSLLLASEPPSIHSMAGNVVEICATSHVDGLVTALMQGVPEDGEAMVNQRVDADRISLSAGESVDFLEPGVESRNIT
jgi:hypothetical protein